VGERWEFGLLLRGVTRLEEEHSMAEGVFMVTEGKPGRNLGEGKGKNRNSHKETQAVTRRSTAQARREPNREEGWEGESRETKMGVEDESLEDEDESWRFLELSSLYSISLCFFFF
jgi:hypothetical protein